MKNLNSFLMAVVMLLGTVSLSAQFGIRGGVNFANVSYDDAAVEVETKSNLAYQLGVFYDAQLTDNFYLRPAILYSVKGSDLETVGVDEDVEFRTSYIEVPLDFMYKIPAGFNYFGIYAGPYAGFLVDATSNDADVKDFYNSLDFGLNVGLTYEFNMGVGIGLNYGLGLANVNDDEDLTDVTVKNNTLTGYLTYRF